MAVAADALGGDRVWAVSMPSCYTAAISNTDAAEQAQRMDVREAGTLTIDLDRLWDRRQVSKALEQIELPDVVLHPLDALAFARRPSSATFVGVTPVEGAITTSPTVGPLRGRIVVVEAADPGYEWMFEMGIAGLVTAYGGANSHMAIRCSERGVPAALGIGLTMFERCKAASRISLRVMRVRSCVLPLIR